MVRVIRCVLFNECIDDIRDMHSTNIMCERLFNDKRVITMFILAWSLACAFTFFCIMYTDNSPFLNFGPSERTELFGVKLDSWPVWWAVAIYTFISTGIGGYASDSIIPWITNTIQDHKTIWIPYSKFTCMMIIQVFTFYGVTQSIIGLFVALTQVDFMFIRLAADLIVNFFTTEWFLRNKTVNRIEYYAWERQQKTRESAPIVSDHETDSWEGYINGDTATDKLIHEHDIEMQHTDTYVTSNGKESSVVAT